MRNQIFSLMLSSVIFTISPLFAMEISEDEMPGLGTLHILPKENIPPILRECSEGSIKGLRSVLFLSKPIYNLCQDNEIWKFIAASLPINVDPSLSIKDQVHNYYTLFTDPARNYSTPMKIFKLFVNSFLNTSVDLSNFKVECRIGNQDVIAEDVGTSPFFMNYCYDTSPLPIIYKEGELDLSAPFVPLPQRKLTSNDIFHKLDLLEDKEHVVFYAQPDEKCFKASFSIITHVAPSGYLASRVVDMHVLEPETGNFVLMNSAAYMEIFDKIITEFTQDAVSARSYGNFLFKIYKKPQ